MLYSGLTTAICYASTYAYALNWKQVEKIALQNEWLQIQEIALWVIWFVMLMNIIQKNSLFKRFETVLISILIPLNLFGLLVYLYTHNTILTDQWSLAGLVVLFFLIMFISSVYFKNSNQVSSLQRASTIYLSFCIAFFQILKYKNGFQSNFVWGEELVYLKNTAFVMLFFGVMMCFGERIERFFGNLINKIKI
ncbi:MAG: hypothetical protein SNJ77_00590 [Cytophagales bacterium]